MAEPNNPPEGGQQESKLIIDSDWKAQAQAEKAKFAEQEKASQSGEQGEDQQGQEGMPPADFRGLMGSMVTQALLYLGGIPEPQSGRPIVSLEYAKHYIDLLEVLQEKTKGNLTDDEKSELDGVVSELRNRFVQVAQTVEQMSQEQAGQGAQGAPGGAGQQGGPQGPITG